VNYFKLFKIEHLDLRLASGSRLGTQGALVFGGSHGAFPKETAYDTKSSK
jgi:hypothetical protein